MYLPTATREEMEVAIIENDIVDINTLPDDIDTEELRRIIHTWIVNGDECFDGC